jgi:DNA-binding MarR family transcriptional regulator
MVKKKDTLVDETEKIKAELAELKKRKKVLDSSKTKKAEAKPTKKTAKKAEAKPVKEKKLTKKELEDIKKEAEKTLEEELEEQLTNEEIENFKIEKVDMERLTNKVCDILAERESDGMFQSELWKKLKLSSRDGSRLALKLERMGTITREKLLEKGRWTYRLIIKKTPISTQSIENAPCLVCPVEQKCSIDGEISPKSCQLIEDWVIAEMKKPAKSK